MAQSCRKNSRYQSWDITAQAGLIASKSFRRHVECDNPQVAFVLAAVPFLGMLGDIGQMGIPVTHPYRFSASDGTITCWNRLVRWCGGHEPGGDTGRD
jgi:hypothetical protein